MSLVGPRPLLEEYLERYSPAQARRHEVLPGVTGWAQINGRNELSWERRLAMDVWYVDRVSLALDARILLTTMWKVISGEGIAAPGHAKLRSAPRCFEPMASYAPPYPLRVITVTFGTVASAYA